VIQIRCVSLNSRSSIRYFTGNYIINGPKTIVDQWPSSKQAQFATVDAILRHSYDPSHACFFSGTNNLICFSVRDQKSLYIIELKVIIDG
jgi:hypothetical protein